MSRRLALVFVVCVGCGRACSAPKPLGDDPGQSLDAAPTSGELPPRCEMEREIALGAEPVELGRMVLVKGTTAMIGARRAGRMTMAELDVTKADATARFLDLAPASGDAPPPMPVIVGERVLSVGYEGSAGKAPLHLVMRDVAAPATPLAELGSELADESLAFDAVASSGTAGEVVVAWDAPADDGSAVFLATLSSSPPTSPKAPTAVTAVPVRISAVGVDADTPRLASSGANVALLLWAAHRALPKSDAAALPEGPGQDPEHAWVEMQSVSTVDGKPIGPLLHVTPDSGDVTTYEIAREAAATATAFDVIARDGLELMAGQGGRLLLTHVQNATTTPSVLPANMVADHAGRGIAAFFPTQGLLLYADPSERGWSSVPHTTSTTMSPADMGPAAEPALDGARPLGVIPAPGADAGLRVLSAAAASGPAQATLRILRCKR